MPCFSRGLRSYRNTARRIRHGNGERQGISRFYLVSRQMPAERTHRKRAPRGRPPCAAPLCRNRGTAGSRGPLIQDRPPHAGVPIRPARDHLPRSVRFRLRYHHSIIAHVNAPHSTPPESHIGKPVSAMRRQSPGRCAICRELMKIYIGTPHPSIPRRNTQARKPRSRVLLHRCTLLRRMVTPKRSPEGASFGPSRHPSPLAPASRPSVIGVCLRQPPSSGPIPGPSRPRDFRGMRHRAAHFSSLLPLSSPHNPGYAPSPRITGPRVSVLSSPHNPGYAPSVVRSMCRILSLSSPHNPGYAPSGWCVSTIEDFLSSPHNPGYAPSDGT